MASTAKDNRKNSIDMFRPFRLFLIGAIILTCASWPVSATDPLFEVEAFLQEQGYAVPDWELLFAWNELAPGAPGVTVYGFHLGSRDQARSIDVYADAAGFPLDLDELSALGVAAKTWSQLPASVPSEIVYSAKAATADTRRAVLPLTNKHLRVAEISLPPLDESAVVAEDDALEGKGSYRLGVRRVFDTPVTVDGAAASHGAWEATADGSTVWAVAVYSPEAYGIRVQFTDLSLPAGGYVSVYDSYEGAEQYGPFEVIHPGDSSLWSPTVFSDRIVVECVLPPGQPPEGVRLSLEAITHNHVDLELFFAKSAGACNLDVACYAPYAQTSLGVAGIGSVGNSGVLWCTGSLVADTDPDTQVPYFLTANHCVGEQDTASSIEIYWRYQRSACNGAVPSPASVPRTTGGADYLAGALFSTGTDFAFMRLRQQPPSGLTWLGWITAQRAAGTQMVCIHHPWGDYKRITFGAVTARPANEVGFYLPPERYYQMTWDQGTTEPGSSGSPIFVADTQQIAGQLYGGLASCNSLDEPDYFGRFDLSLATIRHYLMPQMDIDGSGAIDAVDVQLVINAALGIVILYNADTDASGGIDAIDIQLIINAVLGA